MPPQGGVQGYKRLGGELATAAFEEVAGLMSRSTAPNQMNPAKDGGKRDHDNRMIRRRETLSEMLQRREVHP
jgi:hypothetical protein